MRYRYTLLFLLVMSACVATDPAVVVNDERPVAPPIRDIFPEYVDRLPTGDQVVYDSVPSLNGGLADLRKHIEDLKPTYGPCNVDGKVWLSMILGDDGVPKGIHIVTGLTNACDIRAVEALAKTRWKPGMIDGKPAWAFITLPVRYRQGG